MHYQRAKPLRIRIEKKRGYVELLGEVDQKLDNKGRTSWLGNLGALGSNVYYGVRYLSALLSLADDYGTVRH